MNTPRPHTTVHGVPGVGYVRRSYQEGDTIAAANGHYTVTCVTDDGDVFGDGSANLDVYTELVAEDLRVCRDKPPTP